MTPSISISRIVSFVWNICFFLTVSVLPIVDIIYWLLFYLKKIIDGATTLYEQVQYILRKYKAVHHRA